MSGAFLESLGLRLGLGTLTLCDRNRPDEFEARNLIQFAVQQGIRLIDTAPSYCLDMGDFHFGEHLVRQSLRALRVLPEDMIVATKTGMLRHGGKWIPCGTRQHLLESVEESRKALDVEAIPLLLLHVRDPQVAFEESLEALAELKQQNKVQHIGLCNSSVSEVRIASQFFEVACIQNELSVFQTSALTSGLLQFAKEQGITFLAHRPLGGHARKKAAQDSFVLKTLAERHQCSPEEVALAALRLIDPTVIPLIGATRLSSVRSSIKSLSIPLDVSDHMALSMEFPLTSGATSGQTGFDSENADSPVTPGTEPDIVLIMGIQGAGKSDRVVEFVQTGYVRLNRDELGGTLEELNGRLQQLIAQGHRRVVLDNTYANQASRRPAIQIGQAFGIPVRCLFIDTPLNEAWQNIALRMVTRYGVPLGPEEMKLMRKFDPNLPPPPALLKWQQSFEPPSRAEGFTQVERQPFVRRSRPEHTNKGLLLDVDGTLRATYSGDVFPRSPDDVRILPRRTEILSQWVAAGYQLFFVSNQAGIAMGQVPDDSVRLAMLRTAELLGVPVTEITYCSHPSTPPSCFCRKPMPGLGIYLIEKYRLDRQRLVMVGDRKPDQEFAEGLGIRYYDEAEFFSGTVAPGQA
ncbi:MAG: aldo/keto reductase [Planctomycetaceae bacterium]